MRIHGESSPHSRGAHDICTVRNTRSGCGMQIVTRPSAAVSPVMPFGEPLVFSGDPDDEDAAIEEKVWVVKSTIQSMLNRGLKERKSIFF